MTAFAESQPITRQVEAALHNLNMMRRDGDPAKIYVCMSRLDRLLERIACRPLKVIDPELDERLSVR